MDLLATASVAAPADDVTEHIRRRRSAPGHRSANHIPAAGHVITSQPITFEEPVTCPHVDHRLSATGNADRNAVGERVQPMGIEVCGIGRICRPIINRLSKYRDSLYRGISSIFS